MSKKLMLLVLISTSSLISEERRPLQKRPLRTINLEEALPKKKASKVSLDRNYYNALVAEARRAIIEKDLNSLMRIIDVDHISPNHAIEMMNQRYLGTLLDLAVEANFIQAAQFLISRGANVNKALLKNPKYTVFDKNKLGFTPLHFAAQNANLEMVKLLVRNGGNINARAIANPSIRYGGKLTPLHVIAINYRKPNSFEIVKYLIKNGAQINAKTGNYKKAIDIVKPGIIMGGSKKIYEYLKNLSQQKP